MYVPSNYDSAHCKKCALVHNLIIIQSDHFKKKLSFETKVVLASNEREVGKEML